MGQKLSVRLTAFLLATSVARLLGQGQTDHRYAMGAGPLADKLRGIVEYDEAFIGGRRKNAKGRVPSEKRKAMVVTELTGLAA